MSGSAQEKLTRVVINIMRLRMSVPKLLNAIENKINCRMRERIQETLARLPHNR